MRSRSLLPQGGAGIVSFLLGVALIVGAVLLPRTAFADPHAVFYTDNGFKQVFYAVLAALNQADYVEPPGQPKNIRPNPPAFTEFDGNPDLDAVQLPRLRVRAVTPDDGDVYYRQIVLEEKRVIRALGNLNGLSCKIMKWLKPSEYQAHQCSRIN